MSICNYLAPNGQRSQLYEGLSQLTGPERAHFGWYKMRSQVVMERSKNWELFEKDANGEPTLVQSLRVLGLGTIHHMEQHNLFVKRWSLKPVPNTMNRYYSGPDQRRAMKEQIKKSGWLYNLLHVYYDPDTRQIIIDPIPIKTVLQMKKQGSQVEEYSEAAKVMQQQIEDARAAALKESSKPYGTLNFIQDSVLLEREIEQEVEAEDGRKMTRTIKAGKWQAAIRKDFEIFTKLVKCIN